MKSPSPHRSPAAPATSSPATHDPVPLRAKPGISNSKSETNPDDGNAAGRTSHLLFWISVLRACFGFTTFLPWAICAAAFACANTSRAAVVTFEDLPLAADSYWNGADGSGGFVSGGASFENFCEPASNYWEGFAYSNRTDPNVRGYQQGQYNAICGSGQGGSANYGVVYVDPESLPKLTFARPQSFSGLYVTNNCYGYYDMRDGSTFGKKFGGADGNDPDWFKLTITGIDANDQPTGTVEFYLADYRFDDNARDYIVTAWTFVDLASLGEVTALQFALNSSDVNNGGMKTPAYVCIDTIVSGIDDDSDATNEQATDSTAILPGDNP